jgi:hypothetical protein
LKTPRRFCVAVNSPRRNFPVFIKWRYFSAAISRQILKSVDTQSSLTGAFGKSIGAKVYHYQSILKNRRGDFSPHSKLRFFAALKAAFFRRF